MAVPVHGAALQELARNRCREAENLNFCGYSDSDCRKNGPKKPGIRQIRAASCVPIRRDSGINNASKGFRGTLT